MPTCPLPLPACVYTPPHHTPHLPIYLQFTIPAPCLICLPYPHPLFSPCPCPILFLCLDWVGPHLPCIALPRPTPCSLPCSQDLQVGFHGTWCCPRLPFHPTPPSIGGPSFLPCLVQEEMLVPHAGRDCPCHAPTPTPCPIPLVIYLPGPACVSYPTLGIHITCLPVYLPRRRNALALPLLFPCGGSHCHYLPRHPTWLVLTPCLPTSLLCIPITPPFSLYPTTMYTACLPAFGSTHLDFLPHLFLYLPPSPAHILRPSAYLTLLCWVQGPSPFTFPLHYVVVLLPAFMYVGVVLLAGQFLVTTPASFLQSPVSCSFLPATTMTVCSCPTPPPHALGRFIRHTQPSYPTFLIAGLRLLVPSPPPHLLHYYLCVTMHTDNSCVGSFSHFNCQCGLLLFPCLLVGEQLGTTPLADLTCAQLTVALTTLPLYYPFPLRYYLPFMCPHNTFPTTLSLTPAFPFTTALPLVPLTLPCLVPRWWVEGDFVGLLPVAPTPGGGPATAGRRPARETSLPCLPGWRTWHCLPSLYPLPSHSQLPPYPLFG